MSIMGMDDESRAVTLAFMKRASRDTFKLCAESAEKLAAEIESGALPMAGADACRLLASMFTASSKRD